MQSGESHQQKGVGSQLWGIHDLLLQVVDLKLEVPDLRSGGIRPNLTPGVDPFLHFGAKAISLERMKLYISNLVFRLDVKSTAITPVKVLQYGGAFSVT